jgi:hypothetical protein
LYIKKNGATKPWFLTGSDSSPEGTFDNMWNELEGECYWHLVGGGQDAD